MRRAVIEITKTKNKFEYKVRNKLKLEDRCVYKYINKDINRVSVMPLTITRLHLVN